MSDINTQPSHNQQTEEHGGETARRKARESALQFLYCTDSAPGDMAWDEWRFDMIWRNKREMDEQPPPPESTRTFAETVTRGALEHLAEIDDCIQQRAEHWKLHRMNAIDRNILRIAVYELLYMDDVPKKVAINEAVELGKNFGDKNSGAFVNGVLDAVAACYTEQSG